MVPAERGSAPAASDDGVSRQDSDAQSWSPGRQSHTTAGKEKRMPGKNGVRMGIFTLALAAAGLLGAVVTGYSQTPGMERRDDRREDRQDARGVRQTGRQAGRSA